jgi:hypothetical protein
MMIIQYSKANCPANRIRTIFGPCLEKLVAGKRSGEVGPVASVSTKDYWTTQRLGKPVTAGSTSRVLLLGNPSLVETSFLFNLMIFYSTRLRTSSMNQTSHHVFRVGDEND